jgi:glutaredoxin 3
MQGRIHTFVGPVVVATILWAASVPSCNKTGPDATDESTMARDIPALAGFMVKEGDETLLFQFVDAASGKLESTGQIGDIPSKARENVIVLCTSLSKGDLPANLVIMANLTSPGADGTYPFRLVSRYKVGSGRRSQSGSAPMAQRTPQAGKVLLFSTQWCPHCRTAANWLKTNGVPFDEKNVESDPTAQQLLLKLGTEQGIPGHMLSSVPILYVKGKLIIGFNQSEVARLLGK